MNSSWRIKLLWTLAAAAVLELVVAGFYAVVNNHGVQAWKQCQRDLAARGETLDWTNFIPTPVPDDQNFFKAPMMAGWFAEDLTNSPDTLRSILKNTDAFTNDITKISASNYLAWSSGFAPIFNPIQNAIKRPFARLDRDSTGPLDSSPISPFAYIAVADVLNHQAKCHMVLGDSDLALRDLRLLFSLGRTVIGSDKPCSFKAGTFAYRAVVNSYRDAVSWGLNSHVWNKEQLSELQKQLANIDLLKIEADSIRNLSATECHEIDTLFARERAPSRHSSKFDTLGWWLMPTGLLVQNKVLIYSIEEQMLDRFDVTNHLVSPSKAKINKLRINELSGQAWPKDFEMIIVMPCDPRTLRGCAFYQTSIDQAQIVCALERYRLAYGEYPSDLATLAPQYMDKIPHDIIGGKPMNYVRKDDQHFLLYSVGWNEADDGGTIVSNESGHEDRENGDWVWHYPSN